MLNNDANFVVNKWSTYKYLLIDADNTLYEILNVREIYDKAIRTIFKSDNGLDFNYSELYDELKRFARSELKEYFWVTKPVWFLTVSFLKFFALKSELSNSDILKKVFKLSQEAYKVFKQEVLKNLRCTKVGANLGKIKRGKTVIVISEEEKSFLIEKLEASGVIKFIDYIISSSDTGYLKPHKKYFTLVKELYDVDFSKALYIDDTEGNLELARKEFLIDVISTNEFESIIQRLV